jgi:uncharacterized protein YjbI with pentapeptide repeats
MKEEGENSTEARQIRAKRDSIRPACMPPTPSLLGDVAQRLRAESGQSCSWRFVESVAISVTGGSLIAALVSAAHASAQEVGGPASAPFGASAGQVFGPLGSFGAVVEVALLIGMISILVISWRTQRIAAAAISAAQGGTATERWRDAVALLGRVGDDGTPTIEARLGAIYTLEQAARDAPSFRAQTVELLAAYVRHRAPSGGTGLEPAVDVQSALTVLGRNGVGKLDLRRTALWGIDLEGAGLEGSDFSEVRLGRARLDNFRLTGTRFRNANLTFASLVGADLSAANLRGASLVGADLSGANLRGADLVGVDLSRAQLCGADLGETEVASASFAGATLDGADLSGLVLQDVNLEGASLRGARLLRTDLQGARPANADLSTASMRGATLRDLDLRTTRLNQCLLAEADLSRAAMTGTDLRGARLQDATLYLSDLAGAFLQGADLQGADLIGANLQDAHLERANLTGASLIGADVRRANLTEATLDGADLERADLTSATLTGTSTNGTSWKGTDRNHEAGPTDIFRAASHAVDV